MVRQTLCQTNKQTNKQKPNQTGNPNEKLKLYLLCWYQNWLKCERMLEDCRYSSEWVCLTLAYTFEVGSPVGHNVFKNLAVEPYWIKNETGGRLWEKQ